MKTEHILPGIIVIASYF